MEATARHVLDQHSVAQELKGNANTASGRCCRPWPARAVSHRICERFRIRRLRAPSIPRWHRRFAVAAALYSFALCK